MEFPATIWTLIESARLNGDIIARQSLETFCQQYRGLVIQFFRQRGVIENRVEDMAHDFLLNLMEHDTLRRVDRTKGRFRSYLLVSLRNFMVSDIIHQQAVKRGGGAEHVSVDQAGWVDRIPDPADPEVNAHDRAWAVNLITISYSRLKQEAAERGRGERFAKLSPFLLPGRTTPAIVDLAAEMGVTPETLRTDLHRLRMRLRELFREEVARTVGDDQEVESEINYLHEILRHPAAAALSLPAEEPGDK